MSCLNLVVQIVFRMFLKICIIQLCLLLACTCVISIQISRITVTNIEVHSALISWDVSHGDTNLPLATLTLSSASTTDQVVTNLQQFRYMASDLRASAVYNVCVSYNTTTTSAESCHEFITKYSQSKLAAIIVGSFILFAFVILVLVDQLWRRDSEQQRRLDRLAGGTVNFQSSQKEEKLMFTEISLEDPGPSNINLYNNE